MSKPSLALPIGMTRVMSKPSLAYRGVGQGMLSESLAEGALENLASSADGHFFDEYDIVWNAHSVNLCCNEVANLSSINLEEWRGESIWINRAGVVGRKEEWGEKRKEDLSVDGGFRV